MTELTNEREWVQRTWMECNQDLFAYTKAVLARRATPSSDCALPPLPEPAIAKGKGFDDVWAEHDYFTAEQVEQIRREAVEADRRARGHAALQALADQAQELDMGYGPPASAAQDDDDVERRLRAQTVAPFGPEGFALLVDAAQYIAGLRAQLEATTTNLQTAVQAAWTANAALSKAKTQLARQSQEPQGQAEPVHFYRQKGTSVWIECVTDPRKTFENSPAKSCWEYRTLYAAPAHPVAQPAPTQPTQQQANVLPPVAAPVGQQDAIISTLPIEKIVQLMDENTDRDFGLLCEPFARAVEVETIRRSRAQGGHGEQCTCPSGDGSLRWPCPAHPPVAGAQPVAVEQTPIDEIDCIEPILDGVCVRCGMGPCHQQGTATSGADGEQQ
jgi:hypothetical protein